MYSSCAQEIYDWKKLNPGAHEGLVIVMHFAQSNQTIVWQKSLPFFSNDRIFMQMMQIIVETHILFEKDHCHPCNANHSMHKVVCAIYSSC